MNISNARIEVTLRRRQIFYYMHINFVYTRFIISKNFRIASICIRDLLTVHSYVASFLKHESRGVIKIVNTLMFRSHALM